MYVPATSAQSAAPVTPPLPSLVQAATGGSAPGIASLTGLSEFTAGVIDQLRRVL